MQRMLKRANSLGLSESDLRALIAWEDVTPEMRKQVEEARETPMSAAGGWSTADAAPPPPEADLSKGIENMDPGTLAKYVQLVSGPTVASMSAAAMSAITENEPPRWGPLGDPLNDAAFRSPHWDQVISHLRWHGTGKAKTRGDWIKDEMARALNTLEDQREMMHGLMPADVLEGYWWPNPPASPVWALALRLIAASGGTMALVQTLNYMMSSPEDFIESAPLIDDFAVDLGAAVITMHSTPFLIDHSAAVAIMDSTPPDEKLTSLIRLPFPSVLVAFPAVAVQSLDGMDIILLSDSGKYRGHDTKIVGVVLHGDEDGRLLPSCTWIIETNLVEDIRTYVACNAAWREGQMAHVILNLAAYVYWGDWHSPAPAPRLAAVKERREYRTAAVKRDVKRGAGVVHVVNVRKTMERAGTVSDLDEYARHRIRGPVGTHWRKGHPRRYRIGAHKDWPGWDEAILDRHYVVHLIPPVLINAGLGEAPDSVYRVKEVQQ